MEVHTTGLEAKLPHITLLEDHTTGLVITIHNIDRFQINRYTSFHK